MPHLNTDNTQNTDDTDDTEQTVHTDYTHKTQDRKALQNRHINMWYQESTMQQSHQTPLFEFINVLRIPVDQLIPQQPCEHPDESTRLR
jgi:hypothetical protein